MSAAILAADGVLADALRKRKYVPASEARIERMRAGITLIELSVASGVPVSALALSERGERELSTSQAEARGKALELLAGELPK